MVGSSTKHKWPGEVLSFLAGFETPLPTKRYGGGPAAPSGFSPPQAWPEVSWHPKNEAHTPHPETQGWPVGSNRGAPATMSSGSKKCSPSPKREQSLQEPEQGNLFDHIRLRLPSPMERNLVAQDGETLPTP